MFSKIQIIFFIFFSFYVNVFASEEIKADLSMINGTWSVLGNTSARIIIDDFNEYNGKALLIDKQRKNKLDFKLIKSTKSNEWFVLSTLHERSNKKSKQVIYLSELISLNSLDNLQLKLFYNAECLDLVSNEKIECHKITNRLWNTNLGNIEIISKASKELLLARIK